MHSEGLFGGQEEHEMNNLPPRLPDKDISPDKIMEAEEKLHAYVAKRRGETSQNR